MSGFDPSFIPPESLDSNARDALALARALNSGDDLAAEAILAEASLSDVAHFLAGALTTVLGQYAIRAGLASPDSREGYVDKMLQMLLVPRTSTPGDDLTDQE